MTQREIDQPDTASLRTAVAAAIKALHAKLNLSGSASETVEDILDASHASDPVQELLATVMYAECQHPKGTCTCDFPQWFVDEARPTADKLELVWQQYQESNREASR